MAQDTQTEADSGTDAEPTPGAFDGSIDREGDHARQQRARNMNVVIVPQTDEEGRATGAYDVVSESESIYTVEFGACTCMDHQQREADCKHQRRVLKEVNQGTLPAAGEHVGDYMERTLASQILDYMDVQEGDGPTPEWVDTHLGALRTARTLWKEGKAVGADALGE